MRSVREMAIVLPELAPGGDDAGALEETKGEGPDRPPALALRSGIDDGHFAFGTDGLAQDPDIDPLRRHRWRADQEGVASSAARRSSGSTAAILARAFRPAP